MEPPMPATQGEAIATGPVWLLKPVIAMNVAGP